MEKSTVWFIFVFVTLVTSETMAQRRSCSDDEEYFLCGTACPISCSKLGPPSYCPEVCSSGCFCMPPKVRQDKTGKCVDVEDCPAEPCLNENEMYDSCRGGCEPSCFDPEPICNKVYYDLIINKICMGGCICASGLLRNDAGDCVSVEKCPNNGTDVTLLAKYLNAINNILHL